MDALQDYADALGRLPGVDWSDIYFQRSAGRRAYFSDGKLEEVSSGSVGGYSARILKGKRTAFAVVSGVERGGASRAFADSCRIAAIDAPSLPPQNFPFERPKVYFPDDIGFLAETDALLRKECPWIRQVSVSCSSGVRRFAVVYPGSVCSEEDSSSSFAVSIVIERDGRREVGASVLSKRCSAEDFFKDLQTEKVARRALSRALKNLETVECPTGPMPVILSNKAGGTMIHEACGHGMEADLAFEQNSSFAGKIGQRVAAECVTVIDDATRPGLYGSYDFDDEGTPAARTVLIENGILKSYLTDRRSARLYNQPMTGNGRRQSYSSLPLPRMSNTFVAEGSGSQNEMIQSVPRGLFVCRMGGGEVNTTTGEFVFEVTEGHLIEDGKITKPVKGASLIGRGIDALKGIRAVGNELHMKPGMCGKKGQNVPVTDGQPSLLIDGLVVGGTAAWQ